jgi:hypothetical protein
MIAILLHELAAALAPATLIAADGDDSPVWLLIFGPVAGGGMYFGLWRYYRNTHTSHAYESETRIAAQPVTGNDAKVKSITGTKKSGIDGDNHSNHRKRVQRVD